MKIKIITTVLLLLGLSTLVRAQEKTTSPEFLKYTNSKWVDSVMKSLTPKEKIGQLMFVAAYSNKGKEHEIEILDLIKKWNIGGLVFFQGDPVTQVRQMNMYQKQAKTPLLGAIDAEWGLGMRLDSTISYPYQMALGAIEDNTLIYNLGVEVARQIKSTGLHLNFAPVADVNNNPENPVINYRSFGENKYKVAQKSVAYMQGMQDAGLLTTAKHFPGHGDTNTDSHYNLPQINHSLERLNNLELYPFKELINAGINGIMVAHLNIPALDASGKPSTLSKAIVTDLLQDRLGFKGLIITDAMRMKGVTNNNKPGIVDKEAVLAGNDVLELTQDVAKAILEIENAVKKKVISQVDIDNRVRKILAAKQWAKLNHYSSTPSKELIKDLNSPKANLLKRQLVEASLTVIKNDDTIIPLKKLDTLNIMSISIGDTTKTVFQKSLSLYTKINHFNLGNNADAAIISTLKKEIEKHNLLIVGIHDSSAFPKNKIEFSKALTEFVENLPSRKTIVSYFKNPYSISKIKNIEEVKGIVLTYQDNNITQDIAAQLIFGGVSANGKLPISIGSKFKSGDGITTSKKIRFKYTLPEDAGLNSKILNSRIDSLVQQAIANKAIPGAQVLVAKNGKVVLHKAYGTHIYSDTTKVNLSNIYDIASVTKISSALPALMQLQDLNKFDVENTIDDYLPYFKGSNKADISLKQILTHQAGFSPWIPYWQKTLRKNGSYKWNTIKKDSSARFPLKITYNMWLHHNYKKKIFKAIKKSPVSDVKKYKYSGLLFYLLPTMVEKITNTNFVDYVNANFYNKLGATTLTYTPSKKFNNSSIIPTENDYLFRHNPIHGTVHDEGAAMMGGISANAGLFSNANDLAKLMQMYLNMGTYGNEEYISSKTLKQYTSVQFPENNNHRGIGFDKPYLTYKGENSNTAKDASKESFGHTGFTGTMVWMDPINDVLFIFLSNRVTPTRDNRKLYTLNTRTNIQQVIYDAMQ
ncbi:glycoside hydrolase family 3 N-terminal domain-containing protein [Cellulophaga fucicola]|uniref:beta-N-acetylhexosaminidase n=1 Tax=Cellulophaga fucicola TaxID=76595 RepID=A0A1K1QVR7_9FLAO|nr:glycoside hydrolase family 3 N-terminal domain-containing protein [Cellulophaga fucicola]SFW63780.1 beta-glucosidase [Cellulophaga fucicola]